MNSVELVSVQMKLKFRSCDRSIPFMALTAPMIVMMVL